MTLMGPLREGNLCSQKKEQSCLFAREHLDKPKAFWKSILWTDESKIDSFGHNQNHQQKSQHWIPRKEPPPNSEAWWWKCKGLGLLFCLRAWTTPYYPGKLEISGLSTNSWRESPAISHGAKAGTKMSDETRQRPGNGLKEGRFILWIGLDWPEAGSTCQMSLQPLLTS